MVDLVAANPFIRFAVLGGLFFLVLGVSLALVHVSASRATIRRGLQAIASGRSTQAGTPSLRDVRNDAASRIVARIERAGLNLADSKSDVLRQRLIAAGYKSPAAPRLYVLIRLVLVVVAPTTFVGLTLLVNGQLSFLKLYLFGSLSAVAGLYLPALFVRAKADRNRQEIINGFPDCLDLMLVCVEAGLGLEAAIDRVGREMAASHPLVAEMLATATLQLRAGASREVALRRMADAAGVDEIRSFATLLVQSDRLGSSIATALRIYASEMREKRRMRAEEKAHRIPVLISVPLVACMLPVMIGVLVLPAAVKVVRNVAPAMQGQK